MKFAAIHVRRSIVYALTGLSCGAFGFAPAGGSEGVGAITACDRMTAAAYDEHSIAPAVTWAILTRISKNAVAACEEALAQDIGNPRLTYQLGRAFDADRRYKLAAENYQEIAEDYSAAKSELASLYATGQGVDQDQERAFRLASEAAVAGNKHGLALLGRFYALGIGTPVDGEMALEMLSKAAELGFGPGMEGLGDLYLNGIGVEKDRKTAVSWYEKAAAEGRIRAAAGVANWYRTRPEGLARALYWYSLAARAGNEDSMNALGVMFLRGDGVEQNPEAAIEWFEKSAAQGDAQGMQNLGDVYAAQGEWSQAQQWYEKSAAAGNPLSAFLLAVGHDQKRFGPDYKLAVEYLIFAALSGHKDARKVLVEGLPGNWADETRRALQSRLGEEGLYDGPIDGQIGPGTVQAIIILLQG